MVWAFICDFHELNANQSLLLVSPLHLRGVSTKELADDTESQKDTSLLREEGREHRNNGPLQEPTGISSECLRRRGETTVSLDETESHLFVFECSEASLFSFSPLRCSPRVGRQLSATGISTLKCHTLLVRKRLS